VTIELHDFYPLVLAIGLGMLVGLQRERAAEPVAGIRTFPLITLLGALSTRFADGAPWVPAAALLALAGLLVQANFTRMRGGQADAGLTTEVAALVMFLVGALLGMGRAPEAVAVGGVVAVLLHAKEPLHQFSRAMGEAEFRAVIRLVLIALVILPVLPNQAFGPYGVLNPFEIWLMVVLIVGVSLGAYVIQRLLGPRAGVLLGGALGGFISSTATTVGYARRAKSNPDQVAASTVVIVLASTTVLLRVMLVVALVASAVALELLLPVAAMAVLMAALCAVTLLVIRHDAAESPRREPPSDLRAAIVFGLLYALVLLAVAYGRDALGEQGLFLIAAVSGLTDVDAIVLSTAQLARLDQIDPATGGRVILVGTMANLVFKGALAGLLGGAALFVRVALVFGAALVGGAAILVLVT
jgi:uncharacterized membrane protein (DUF4010 family)